MKHPIFLLLLSCLSLAQCTKESSYKPPEDLAQAKSLWESKKIDSYTMTFNVSCFCIVDLNKPAEVVVKKNKIITVNGIAYDNSFPLYGSYKTIQELFSHIEEMQKKNPVVEELEFDPTYGFPSYIYYDVSEIIADEEIGYRVSDFKPQ